jgi:hypothetical protein
VTLDPFIAEVGHGMGRLRWAKFAGTVGPSTVVVANVLREHHTQVPLTEDQRAVGEFGSEGALEPFGETVRPRATRWNPDHADAHIGQDRVEQHCELAGRSRMRNRNWVTRSPRSMIGLRICWIVHVLSGFIVIPRRCTDRLATSRTKNT